MFTSTTLKKYIVSTPLDLQKLANLLDGQRGISVEKVLSNYIFLKHKNSKYLIVLHGKTLDIRLKLSTLWYTVALGLPILVLALKIAVEGFLSNDWNEIVSIILVLLVIAWLVYLIFFRTKLITREFLNIFREKIIVSKH